MTQGKVVYSDLQFSGSSLDIAVFSPGVYGQNTKAGLSDGKFFSSIVDTTIHFMDMHHTGMLTLSGGHSSTQTQGQPLKFVRCGGKAYIVGHSWISCDKCTMVFQILQYDNERFKNTMFHLMLKQMVPGLPCCNFVDCSVTPETDNLTAKKLVAIRSLGVVAVDCCLQGLPGKAEEGKHYGLGFTLMPGMCTHGPEGLGPWLQYLVCRKFQQLKELHETKLPMLFGPKPMLG